MNGSRTPHESGRPYVIVNMAMTADGRIATANRAVSSFGSARDHDHLLALRATADAVMAGARTVDSAKINLGPGPLKFRRQRRQHGLAEYNLRVIVTGSGSLHPGAHVFKHRFSPILILTSERATRTSLSRLRKLADEVRVCGQHAIDFGGALRWLKSDWGVNRLVCEGGGALNDALFRADLVDELHVTVCPFIFGGRSAPTIADGLGQQQLERARHFEVQSQRKLGAELLLVLMRPRAA